MRLEWFPECHGAELLEALGQQRVFRQSGVIELDPLAAQQVVGRSMQASHLPGLDKWSVIVHGNTVAVTGTLRVSLLALGTAALTETRSATFVYGT